MPEPPAPPAALGCDWSCSCPEPNNSLCWHCIPLPAEPRLGTVEWARGSWPPVVGQVGSGCAPAGVPSTFPLPPGPSPAWTPGSPCRAAPGAGTGTGGPGTRAEAGDSGRRGVPGPVWRAEDARGARRVLWAAPRTQAGSTGAHGGMNRGAAGRRVGCAGMDRAGGCGAPGCVGQAGAPGVTAGCTGVHREARRGEPGRAGGVHGGTAGGSLPSPPGLTFGRRGPAEAPAEEVAGGAVPGRAGAGGGAGAVPGAAEQLLQRLVEAPRVHGAGGAAVRAAPRPSRPPRRRHREDARLRSAPEPPGE